MPPKPRKNKPKHPQRNPNPKKPNTIKPKPNVELQDLHSKLHQILKGNHSTSKPILNDICFTTTRDSYFSKALDEIRHLKQEIDTTQSNIIDPRDKKSIDRLLQYSENRTKICVDFLASVVAIEQLQHPQNASISMQIEVFDHLLHSLSTPQSLLYDNFLGYVQSNRITIDASIARMAWFRQILMVEYGQLLMQRMFMANDQEKCQALDKSLLDIEANQIKLEAMLPAYRCVFAYYFQPNDASCAETIDNVAKQFILESAHNMRPERSAKALYYSHYASQTKLHITFWKWIGHFLSLTEIQKKEKIVTFSQEVLKLFHEHADYICSALSNPNVELVPLKVLSEELMEYVAWYMRYGTGSRLHPKQTQQSMDHIIETYETLYQLAKNHPRTDDTTRIFFEASFFALKETLIPYQQRAKKRNKEYEELLALAEEQKIYDTNFAKIIESFDGVKTKKTTPQPKKKANPKKLPAIGVHFSTTTPSKKEDSYLKRANPKKKLDVSDVSAAIKKYSQGNASVKSYKKFLETYNGEERMVAAHILGDHFLTVAHRRMKKFEPTQQVRRLLKYAYACYEEAKQSQNLQIKEASELASEYTKKQIDKCITKLDSKLKGLLQERKNYIYQLGKIEYNKLGFGPTAQQQQEEAQHFSVLFPNESATSIHERQEKLINYFGNEKFKDQGRLKKEQGKGESKEALVLKETISLCDKYRKTQKSLLGR